MRVTTYQYEIIGKNQFAQSKRFSPEHNLSITEKNSSEQAAFWHEVKGRVLPSDSPFTLRLTCFVFIFLIHQYKLFQNML